ncbi:MAG: caspase family protein [Bradyrhizobium sp.]|nr:caspase family protein [Bradyrhizobium sp.]
MAILAVVSLPVAGAAASEKRLALVIGNASYKVKALATTVNDAALVARTLQAAGFDVMGARDLDGDLLRKAFRDFIDKVTDAGPDAVAAVYFAGYGLQFEGENYLIPTDVDISEASDVPVRALRLSEQMHALAALHLKERFIILDMARAGPFVLPDLAGGLAWVEPEANMLIAFNAAPGTVAPDVGEGYGPYAKALAEMIREGDLTSANLFDRVRLRVNELTGGAQVPWDASKIETQFKFLERAPDAPFRADSSERTSWMRLQPMRSIGAHEAYLVALMRDTLDAYADFLADYWHDPMTRRVQALLAARREAITWRRTCQANVPEAYWSYLERYPRGPHGADAGRLLRRLGASIAPPSNFARMDYDVPAPLPDELEYIERTVLVFDDPAFTFEQPQPPPVYFLAKSQPEFLDLTPPPTAPSQAHLLPTSNPLPLPAYVHVPADVAEPKAQLLNDAHEMLNVKTANDGKTNKDERDASLSISPHKADNADPGGGVRLPTSVAAKATLLNSQSPSPPAVNPAASKEIKVPSAPSLKTVTLTPQGSTDKTLTSTGTEPRNSTIEVEAPIPVPTTLTSPSTGVLSGAWSSEMLLWRATGGGPLPVPRSLARSRTGLSPRTPGFTMPSSETTGSIRASIPQSVTLAPPSTGVPSGAWSSDMRLWRSSGSGSLPVPQSAALARSGTGFPPRTPGSTMSSPGTTGSIPASVLQSVTPVPPSTGVLLGTWSNDVLMWRSSGSGPLAIRRSRALERLRTGLLPRTPGSPMPPPETTGSIPASIPQSATLTPPSAGVLSGAWSSDMLLWRATAGGPLPVPRSVTLARSRTSLSSRTPGSSIPLRQTTGGIHPSISQSVAPALPSTRQRSKPIAEAASTSSR